MLEPLAVDTNRSVAPAANNMPSARLVFPAPAGPTSAITRVPLVDSPAMRLSLRPVAGARVASQEGARAPKWKRPPSACFKRKARGVVTVPGSVRERSAAPPGLSDRKKWNLRRRQQPSLAGKPQQRCLELFERAYLDLADAFAADAVDLAQLLERLRLVGEAPLHQD